MEETEGCKATSRSDIRVERKVLPRIEEGVEATITIDERRAVDLAVFLWSEVLRRRQDFEKTDMMQCWVCLGTAEDLLRALKAAGFHPANGHL